jgi:GMP synthase (glutamine-hydrolysing)
MRKVLVFQHVAHKILGTLNPTLKERGLNIRYVNFERTPDERPSLDRYNGLIVMGGHMGVYEADKYQHIKVELQLIEEALKKGIPILGICLGSQLIAKVLGSHVRKHAVKEIGWYDVNFHESAQNDFLLGTFNSQEKLFQMHGDTFDIPSGAVHLASTSTCPSQAFRYGDKVYGLQFHLEVDEGMIQRWLTSEKNYHFINDPQQSFSIEQIKNETQLYLDRSMELSVRTFAKFVELFALKERPLVLGSEHSKPHKKKLSEEILNKKKK